MEKKTFHVPNIGCGGCVSTIENELGALAGVKHVKGEVQSKAVTVEWEDPANWNTIVATLKDIDYAPAEA
ncbi:MAG: heavy-metal-associated domain-containing protein [Anaerolineae bacterium]|nr:heavy-metal-associated domain-containing protein [Anaerolineae bacterium]